MKNLFNLGFVVLLLVVLGCNCQRKLQEIAEQAKTPTPTPNSSSSPTSSSSPSTSSSSGLTKVKYEQLKNGMTYKEVVAILGKEGEETSSSQVGSTKIATMKWQGDNYEYIFANFSNDKMTFKSQANLK
jgi:Beta-lactamase inhibitor (BLIP)